MNDEKKLQERLASRSEMVTKTLKTFDGEKVQKFEELLRTYMYVFDKLKWTKISLAALERELENNQKSFLMQFFTRETYQSNQDYFRKIALELKKEFYELEMTKLGITSVYFQKEYELIRDELNNSNLSEEEQAKHQLTCDLYSISLKMKILQRMGCSFV